MDYDAFIAAKACMAKPKGLPCELSEIHPVLKPHQAAIVRWAVEGGQRGIFAQFGSGKTLIGLEIQRIILGKIGGRGLIVCPLGVRGEFMRDAKLIGVEPKFIRKTEEIGNEGIYLTNYESIREGKLNPSGFDVICLDEAGLLRSMGASKTFREMMKHFEGTAKFRFVLTATPSPNEYLELLAYSAFLGVMEVSEGKAQPLDAKILSPSGWKRMGDISVGDEVIAGDGSKTIVTGVFPQGDRQAYRVRFNDGSSTECDVDHLWLTWTQREMSNQSRQHFYADTKSTATIKRMYGTVKSTATIMSSLMDTRQPTVCNHHIPLVGCVQFDSQIVTVDPYVLGVLLGDGHLRKDSVDLSASEDWIIDKVNKALCPDFTLKHRSAFNYSIVGAGAHGKGIGRGVHSNQILNGLRSYGMLGTRSWNKYVPDCYLYNSVDVRLAVLHGLMDTDGTWNERSGCIFNTASHQLATDVQAITRSLGGSSRIWRCKTVGLDSYYTSVRLPDGMNAFSLPRKLARVGPMNIKRKRRAEGFYQRSKRRRIVAVEPSVTKPMQCISVAHESQLYVSDEFIVTHNTRFFKRDSTKADHLTLFSHKVTEFWLWMSSWAVLLQSPKDLGFDDSEYILPPLNVQWHEVPTDHNKALPERNGQGRMFRDTVFGLSEAASEKRTSMETRLAKIKDLLTGLDDQAVIWADLNDEQKAIEKLLTSLGISFVSLYGKDVIDKREVKLEKWRQKEATVLLTKPAMYASGVNLQQCHTMIFAGIGFRFADVIQSIHRIWRFMQQHACNVHLIFTEAEHSVKAILETKWSNHNEQVERMSQIIRDHGLANIQHAGLTRSGDVNRQEASGNLWKCVNNDCVRETRLMESDSVGLLVTSIPFAFQYEYTPSLLDFGHTDSNAHFWSQMDFLTPELFRVMMPGRIVAIHVKDRIVPGGLTGLGFQTLHPFHAEGIFHYQKHGFAFLGMKTVVTDVVRENNQTYRLGWTEQCKDGSRMGCGVPEYVLLFRKPPTDRTDGYADVPVHKDKPLTEKPDGELIPYDYEAGKVVPGTGYSRSKWQLDAHGFQRSSGNRFLTPNDMENLPHEKIYKLWKEQSLSTIYGFESHAHLCEVMERDKRLPSTFMVMPPHSWHQDVWTDIARMRTMNMEQERRGQEMHLCPLQFDIVDRLIIQCSNPGDLIFDPFAGLATVPYCAVKLGRKGLGIELNPGYWKDGCRYCRAAEEGQKVPSLFDLLDAEEFLEKDQAETAILQ